MIQIRFYDTVEDARLAYAVIVARHRGKWVFCRHRGRDTFECPGGHRESGETIEAAARRELWEETGAERFCLYPICVYSVSGKDGAISCETESFGMLYYAEIETFGMLPPFEMARVQLFDALPDRWTYPAIQPMLLRKACEAFPTGRAR